ECCCHAAHADEDVPVAKRVHERNLRAGNVVGDEPGDTKQTNCDEGRRYPPPTRRRLDLFRPRLPLCFQLMLLGSGLSRSRLGHQTLLAVEVGSVLDLEVWNPLSTR